MHTNKIDQEMNTYFMQLTIAEKKSVVQMIKTLLKKEKPVEVETILDEYNKDIDMAMAEVARGEFYTHDEVVKMSENW